MSIKSQALEFNFLGYKFTAKLVPTLLSFIIFPVLISLGLWQLDRADEKRVIDQGVNDAIAKPALALNETDFATLTDQIYRSASIVGNYDIEQQFLLDNRTHKGLPGYHVLSPFLFKHNYLNKSSTYAVLVNRGWIAYQGTRDKITDISVNKEVTEVVGTIKKIPRSIVLKEKSTNDSSADLIFKTENKQLEGVSLIQSIQLERLSKTINYELLPVIIELDKTANHGFVREWQPYYGSIDKHNAYALQWFAMASIVLFLFIKLNIKKN